jgi:mono/diheme cytochrome c family protein
MAGPRPVIASPSPDGAHNWDPMAFHPATGLVYFPAKVGTQFIHAPDPKWAYNPYDTNLGLDRYDGPLDAKRISMPPPTGELVAWDPAAKKAAWRVSLPVVEAGGVLATGGNLIFEGRGDGILAAYRATDGKQLWSFDAGTGIMAPPVTYLVDGIQYLSVLAGWGGTRGLFNAPGSGPVKPGYGRILTFALDGKATLKVPQYGHDTPPIPLESKASKQTIHQGQLLFNDKCGPCHGINAVAGALPDLRYSKQLDNLEAIVLGGSRAAAGMPSFAKTLKVEQLRTIREYIVARTH